METTNATTANTDKTPEAPPAERRPEPPGSTDLPQRLSLLTALAGLVLFFILGLALVLLASLFTVYATGLAARWLGLPELHVTIVFVGVFALVVISFVGIRIGSELAAMRKQIESAIEDASVRVADEVNASTVDFTNAIHDLPLVIVAPEIAPPEDVRPRSKRWSHRR